MDYETCVQTASNLCFEVYLLDSDLIRFTLAAVGALVFVKLIIRAVEAVTSALPFF